jgi:hypothetical protein
VRRCKMKLMYFLMDRDEQREKRLELEFEVRCPVRQTLSSSMDVRQTLSADALSLSLSLCVQVSELETVLEKEQQLGRVLQCSLQGRVVCHCCLSALVPTNVSASHSLLCSIPCLHLHVVAAG